MSAAPGSGPGSGSAVPPDPPVPPTPVVSEARNPEYTPFHPRWYRRRMPISWWLRKWAYTRFIIRELTSLPVGYTALLLVAMAWALARGPEAHEAFIAWLQTPWVVVFHLLILVGLLYHTITWLKLAPKALVFRVRGRKVPDAVVSGSHFAGWIVLSALVFWFLAGR